MGEENDQKSDKSSSSHDTSKDTDMETMKLLVDEITNVVEENDIFAKEKNRRLQELIEKKQL
jgi:hypothetical protein